jgi:uncharacterized protein (DUF433 family)
MATIQSINLISTDPSVRSGRPCIAGTRIEVNALVIEHIFNKRTLGEISADYSLTLAQVHAAFAYYYEHKAELDALMREQDRIAEEFREKNFGSQRPPLHR